QWTVGIDQGLPIPQPYIVNGCLVGLDCLESEVLFGRERLHCDLLKIVCLLGQRDVALDVGPLQLQLIRSDEHALENSWNQARQHERSAENENCRCHGNTEAPQPDVCPYGEYRNYTKPKEKPEDAQSHLYVGRT